MRPFNTFGPRQSARAVIPTILGQLLAGADRVRLGSLRPRRDFTFVEDTVDGFVRMAAGGLARRRRVQLGTGRSVSVAEVLDACCAVVGSTAGPGHRRGAGTPRRLSEVEVLLSDPSRAAAGARLEAGGGPGGRAGPHGRLAAAEGDRPTAGRYQR